MNDFIQMSGHGAYVWTAYGVSVLTLVGLVVAPLRARRKLLDGLQKKLQRQQTRTHSKNAASEDTT
ncbi:MAG: heme exporter protein CcmD [bacterium]